LLLPVDYRGLAADTWHVARRPEYDACRHRYINLSLLTSHWSVLFRLPQPHSRRRLRASPVARTVIRGLAHLEDPDGMGHLVAVFTNTIMVTSGLAYLRSAERRDMLVPRTRTELGRHSFSVSALTVWNSLPAHLCSTLIGRRQFRDGLKSHLFADAYF